MEQTEKPFTQRLIDSFIYILRHPRALIHARKRERPFPFVIPVYLQRQSVISFPYFAFSKWGGREEKNNGGAREKWFFCLYIDLVTDRPKTKKVIFDGVMLVRPPNCPVIGSQLWESKNKRRRWSHQKWRCVDIKLTSLLDRSIMRRPGRDSTAFSCPTDLPSRRDDFRVSRDTALLSILATNEPRRWQDCTFLVTSTADQFKGVVCAGGAPITAH